MESVSDSAAYGLASCIVSCFQHISSVHESGWRTSHEARDKHRGSPHYASTYDPKDVTVRYQAVLLQFVWKHCMREQSEVKNTGIAIQPTLCQ